MVPARLPEGGEIVGRRLGEIATGPHEPKEFTEAFLPTGSSAIPGRLPLRSMETGEPGKPPGRGSLPRLLSGLDVVVIRLRLAELFAEAFPAQGAMETPESMPQFVHAEPAAKEDRRVGSHVDPQGAVEAVDEGIAPSDAPFRRFGGDPEIREADPAEAKVGCRFVQGRPGHLGWVHEEVGFGVYQNARRRESPPPGTW